MGEVYLAEDVVSGRKEALTIMKAHLASDPQFVSWFRREARAINRLRHPNIVAVYDFGQLPDQRFFLSMEYAQGHSVYQLLKRDAHFDVPRALWVLGQLVYAVHHAHSRGVVHRDLTLEHVDDVLSSFVEDPAIAPLAQRLTLVKRRRPPSGQ